MDACCIIVGDEILSGHVRDANGHFIASRLSASGHRLIRITIVSDAPDLIAAAVREDLERKPAWLFVCGGLGPTHDDRTMGGVADALGLALEPCEPIAERIRAIVARMHERGVRGDPLGIAGLEKMALAPAGAEFLQCEAGIMPAVSLVHADVRLFILPGPPRDLQTVFLERVEPGFLAGTGSPLSREEIEHEFPESSLAAALTAIESAHPGVSLGSYPGEHRVLVRIAGPEVQVRAAASEVRDAIARLEASEEGQRLLAYFRARRSSAERHDP